MDPLYNFWCLTFFDNAIFHDHGLKKLKEAIPDFAQAASPGEINSVARSLVASLGKIFRHMKLTETVKIIT